MSYLKRAVMVGLIAVAVWIPGQGGQGDGQLDVPEVRTLQLAGQPGLLPLRRAEGVGDGPVPELYEQRASLGRNQPSPEGQGQRRLRPDVSGGAGATTEGWDLAFERAIATRYGGGAAFGDSADYNGQPLGCGGGLYSSRDPTIIAVAWPDSPFDCGTTLRVCHGAAGSDAGLLDSMPKLSCIVGRVVDHGPGLGYYHLDLSECGMAILAGLTELVEVEVGGGVWRWLCPETFETADFLNVQVSEVTE